MSADSRARPARWKYLTIAAVVGLAALFISSQTCVRTGLSYGLWLDQCPDGDLHQSLAVNASGLTRGAKSPVTLTATALYTSGPADQRNSAEIHTFTPELSLVSHGTETPLVPAKGWVTNHGSATGEVALPQVNDGEYTLRARITSTLGQSTLDLPLPLFAPARVHVVTDRPLYEPGNVVKFRAVVLRGNDLSPIEERPGAWQVIDPSGEVLLDEKAPSGPWGVVSGSFPIDRGATSGEWRVLWHSGSALAERTFSVRPFTLPRFKVDAATTKPFYRRGERPVVKGRVAYSSGAPVPGAAISIQWSASGDWPAPTAWLSGTALPKVSKSADDGTFVLELPVVPEDLQGTATLTASLDVVDRTGDRIEASAAVLLAQDAIAVTGVTELESGLVEGFNNRLFLRATTADGAVLDGVTLNVKRLWEATDRGVDAPTDEDAVATLQLDPGPPVNVIIPAMPFRPPPPTKAVTRQGLEDLLSEDGEVRLADRLSFDRLEAPLATCARYVHGGGETVELGVLVHGSGAQSFVSVPSSRAGRCVTDMLKDARFEPGPERLFQAHWSFDDSDLPNFTTEFSGVPSTPSEVETAIGEALLNARDCLPATVRSGALPRLLEWRLPADGSAVELTWVPVKGDTFSEAAVGCITSRVQSLKLPKQERDPEQAFPVIGVAHLSVTAPEKYETERPQDTVMVGYEFLVTARRGKDVLGSTRLRMSPGQVPNARLRATQQLVDPGATVEVELLRGPEFTGELPETLRLEHAWESVESKVNRDARKVQFKVPPSWQGWASVTWNGAQVFFFVRPKAPLQVSVKSEKPRYAPGDVAQLALETRISGQGARAAVGLMGVDDSLSQLVSLPGADELSHLRAQPSGTSGFGGIDAQALSLGRIRGANAVAATLLRLSALPPPPEVESAVAVQGQTVFDPNEVLVDRFYVVLGELSNRVRDWESSAPPGEKMSNATMARLWNEAVKGLEQRKESASDAWGRPLRLHRLPTDLLALTEPRMLVINGTRLPEDTQNWSQWIAREKP